MEYKDIFAKYFEQTVILLSDLVRFVFQPRHYFKTLNAESGIKSFQRLCIYLVLFHLLTYSILKAASRSNGSLDQFELIGISIIDFTLMIVEFPAFKLASIFCDKTTNSRTIINYMISFKVTYSLVPILFYAFYLISEDYSVALFRGISVYLYAFIYLLFFSIIFSSGIKYRLLTLFTLIISLTLIVMGLVFLTSINPSKIHATDKYNLLYDPIGNEVDEVLESILTREKTDSPEYLKMYFGYPSYQMVVSFSTNGSDWDRDKNKLLAEIKREDSVLVELKINQKYRTTIKIIELKQAEIKALINSFYTTDIVFDIMKKMDAKSLMERYEKDKVAFVKRPEFPKEMERLKALRTQFEEYVTKSGKAMGATITAHHNFVVETNKILDYRFMLVKAGMILR